MKDFTQNPIVLAKVARVSALPVVAAWIDAPDRNRRERALLALAVAHTIAWTPADKRPPLQGVKVYEVDGGAGGKDGRSVLIAGDSEGEFLFAPGHLARVELCRELCLLLFPPDKVTELRGGAFWWYLLARRRNRPPK